MFRYIVDSVSSQLKLERHCPHCGRLGGNIHSGVKYRSITDIKVTAISQQRMKCPFCKTTWTIRADGVGHASHRSGRLIAIGVVLYMLGLSYLSVEKFLPLLDCRGSKSSIERDIAAAGHTTTTERIIGLNYKIRVKTARGFKSWDKILCHCCLSEFLKGNNGVCDLRKVV